MDGINDGRFLIAAIGVDVYLTSDGNTNPEAKQSAVEISVYAPTSKSRYYYLYHKEGPKYIFKEDK
jgi:hypothetical protein